VSVLDESARDIRARYRAGEHWGCSFSGALCPAHRQERADEINAEVRALQAQAAKVPSLETRVAELTRALARAVAFKDHLLAHEGADFDFDAMIERVFHPDQWHAVRQRYFDFPPSGVRICPHGEPLPRFSSGWCWCDRAMRAEARIVELERMFFGRPVGEPQVESVEFDTQDEK